MGSLVKFQQHVFIVLGVDKNIEYLFQNQTLSNDHLL